MQQLGGMDILTIVFTIVGGLAIFLYSIKLLSDSLSKITGPRVVKILERATNSPVKGMGVGTATTVMTQSSSITVLTLIGMVNAGIMTFRQSVNVMLGSEIGTTITAQIVSFNIGLAYYPLIAVFFFLGLLVSCLTRMPKSSIVICLFFWATLVFAVPNIGGLTARGLSPFASAPGLEQKKFQVMWQMGLRGTDIRASNREMEKIEDAYRSKVNQYVEASKKVCRLSPAASFVYFSSTMAKSGFEDERALTEAILRYRDAALSDGAYRSGEVQFSYRGLTLSESLSYVSLDLMLIFLFGALFFAVAYLLFLRYDVR